jgi:dTDP-4-amino-4,6-dideoxygalactose transaminase
LSLKVPYVDFKPTTLSSKLQLNAAFERVLDSGKFILGPEIKIFEQDFAQYCGTKYAAGLSNGTCSLHVVFRAFGIKEGDEVITAPNSFIATAAAITQVGAKPVFVDTNVDFNINPSAIESAITPNTKAIVPVHLTGRVAKMDKILEVAKKHKLLVIEDSAQSVGAEYNGKKAGSFGDAASFSFHPLKNLHAFGDAGIVVSNDINIIEKLNKLKNHGLIDRSTCTQWGLNCRLDELQAAFLRVQLPMLDEWTSERRKIAHYYNEVLAKVVTVPTERDNEKHVYQTYVIQADKRDALKEYLNSNGVEALVHYPVPIHLQPAAKNLNYKLGSFPVVEKLSREILSLPLYPGMPFEFQERVTSLILKFYGKN